MKPPFSYGFPMIFLKIPDVHLELRGRHHLWHRASDFSRRLWRAQLSRGRGQHLWKQGAGPGAA